MSLATLRSVLVSEMGNLGSATADTRSRSLVADRIRHLRIMGCLSPTGQLGTGKERDMGGYRKTPSGQQGHSCPDWHGQSEHLSSSSSQLT